MTTNSKSEVAPNIARLGNLFLSWATDSQGKNFNTGPLKFYYYRSVFLEYLPQTKQEELWTKEVAGRAVPKAKQYGHSLCSFEKPIFDHVFII